MVCCRPLRRFVCTDDSNSFKFDDFTNKNFVPYDIIAWFSEAELKQPSRLAVGRFRERMSELCQSLCSPASIRNNPQYKSHPES